MSLLYTWGMAIKVLLVFILIYFIIPSRIIKFPEESRGFLDKFFISLIQSTLIIIIVSHLLVFIKLYEFFSIVFVCFFIYVLYIRWQRKSWLAVLDMLGLTLIINLLDLSEGRIRVRGVVKKYGQSLVESINKSAKTLIMQLMKHPFNGVLPLAVFIAAAYIRFQHALFSGTFALSDTYGHLAWIKYFGMNQIYHDGVYPYGMQACLAFLAKLFSLDAYWITRFIGPFAGLLIVLSVYYLALRISGSYSAGLLALFIFGIITNPLFPSVVSRQITLLSQEYAMIFILPGLYFLSLYIKTNRKRYFWLYVEALSIAGLIHSYAALYFGLWSVIVIMAGLLIYRPQMRVLLNYLAGSMLAVIISIIPIGIGFFMGNDIYKGASDFVISSIDLKIRFVGAAKFFESICTGNPIVSTSFMAILILIACLIFLSGDKDYLFSTVYIVLTSLFTLLLYLGPGLGLPSLSIPSRTGVFLSLLLPVLFTCSYRSLQILVEKYFPLRRIKAVFNGGVLVICLLIIFILPPQPLEKVDMEYEEAVQNYLVIKHNFPVMDWTIVGPTEQLEEVAGIGWHYDILRFVQKFTVMDMENPAFRFPIPTHHVFVYTEKIPLRSDTLVSDSEADKELEREGNDPFKQFYLNPVQRTIIEAKAIRLMEAYRKTHDNVSIFYENERFRIYYFYHMPKELENM